MLLVCRAPTGVLCCLRPPLAAGTPRAMSFTLLHPFFVCLHPAALLVRLFWGPKGLSSMTPVCLRGGRAAPGLDERGREPVPEMQKNVFLSLCDKLVCQQQEVMLLPSSAKGNSSWFPWGHMQLYNYGFI